MNGWHGITWQYLCLIGYVLYPTVSHINALKICVLDLYAISALTYVYNTFQHCCLSISKGELKAIKGSFIRKTLPQYTTLFPAPYHLFIFLLNKTTQRSWQLYLGLYNGSLFSVTKERQAYQADTIEVFFRSWLWSKTEKALCEKCW